MTSTDFGGKTAEPMIGEVTALRSFRLTDDGYLLPLTDAGGHEPWPTDTHSAKCNRGKEHLSPDPDCTCGFYAYGNRSWVEGHGPVYGWSHLILAAVHCSGRLVAGEKGLRAQRMRLKACYVNKTAPDETLERLRENYPEIEFFTSRKALLAAYPETHLSTYLEPPKRPRLKSVASTYQIVLAILVVPVMFLQIMSIFTSDSATYVRFALLMFAMLVWVPFAFEGIALRRVGMTPERFAAMQRSPQVPWSMRSPSRTSTLLLLRLGLMGLSIGFIITIGDDSLWPFGWPTIAFTGVAVATIVTLVTEAYRSLPVSRQFPLVPRTKAVRDLRATLPADIVLSRNSNHRHRSTSRTRTIEMCDMGGYGIGMIHFDIFSDPEDYPSALGAAPDLTVALKGMANEMGVPNNSWIAYIASDDTTLRVLTPNGKVSPPVPLAEIDSILPLPTRSWCPPGVRSSFIAGMMDETNPEGPVPLSLPSGYQKRRPSLDEFSDPRVRNALKSARHLTEQSAYRGFKQAEALLPEGLEPLAVPTIPEGGREDSMSSEVATTEIQYALRTLLDVSIDPSSARGLVFAIGELLDAGNSTPLNELTTIDFLDAEGDAPPADADREMRGAHILMLGEVGATLGRDFLKTFSYDTPSARIYALVLEGKKGKTSPSMALKVRNESLEGGGDDDVDALKDAGD